MWAAPAFDCNGKPTYEIYYDADDVSGKAKAVIGFGLRVTSHGAKAFIFNYRFKGRSRRITIGRLGAWTVLAARKRAAELRRMVDVGKDPIHERDAEVAGEQLHA